MTTTENVKRFALVAATTGLLIFAACSKNDSASIEVSSPMPPIAMSPQPNVPAMPLAIPILRGQSLATAPGESHRMERVARPMPQASPTRNR